MWRVAGAIVAFSMLGAVCLGDGASAGARPPLPLVAPLRHGVVARDQFSHHEQRAAPYLATLATLANNVEDKDAPTYGFITGDLWRAPNNVPDNPRVQENVLTMAYFLAADRVWNPYYRDDALRQRLEAAFDYLLSLQHPDGTFRKFNDFSIPAYARATTGFVLSAVGHALELLEGKAAIDPALEEALVQSMHRAATWFLTDEFNVWEDGGRYANQVVCGMLGIATLLPRFDDPHLEALFAKRLGDMPRYLQSPAGYYYENDGPGHRYSIEVMSRDMAMLYERTGSPVVKEMQEKYSEWVSYNLLYDPEGLGFFINTATDTRHTGWSHEPVLEMGANNLWTKHIPLTAAFGPFLEQVTADREAWAKGSWNEKPLTSWVNPSVIMELAYPEHFPDQTSKNAAIGRLPYMAGERFTEYRSDVGRRQAYLFVRRPGYYLGMALGSRASRNQRMGLSFLWHPGMGVVIQSQNSQDDLAWGTAFGSSRSLQRDTHGDVLGTFYIDEKDINPETDTLPNTDFKVEYPLIGRGKKQVSVFDGAIHIDYTVRGNFQERIPLVIDRGDRLYWVGSDDPLRFGGASQLTDASGLVIERNGHRMVIDWGAPRSAALSALSTQFFGSSRRLHLLTLTGEGEMAYSIQFEEAVAP